MPAAGVSVGAGADAPKSVPGLGVRLASKAARSLSDGEGRPGVAVGVGVSADVEVGSGVCVGFGLGVEVGVAAVVAVGLGVSVGLGRASLCTVAVGVAGPAVATCAEPKQSNAHDNATPESTANRVERRPANTRPILRFITQRVLRFGGGGEIRDDPNTEGPDNQRNKS